MGAGAPAVKRMSWLHANGPLSQHPDSYYASLQSPMPLYEPLRGATTADVCVVGGGITGLSTALHAAQMGQDVIVLEAARFGWGASGRNGGQVGSGFNWDQRKLEKKLGVEMAAQLWTQVEEAKALTRELIEAHAPEADYQPGIVHAFSREQEVTGYGEHMAHMANRYGQSLDLWSKDEMAARLGTQVFAGGVVDMSAGFCNPLAYVAGLVRACEDAGVRLYERSEVHRLTSGLVQTGGGEVRAANVVHATNGLGPHLTGRVAARVLPINNFIAVTEPLGDAAPMTDPIAVADDRFVVNYFWQTRDGRLVYGGGESYGKRYPTDIATRVRQNLGRVYPELADVRFDHAWGGTLAVTATRLPYVADLGGGVFAAGGYSGHGLALSGLAGKVLAEAICGDRTRLGLLGNLPVPALPGGRMFGGLMATGGMMWAAAMDRLRG